VTNYIKTGNVYRVTDDLSMTVTKELPVGNYIVQVDPMGNMFLQRVDAFSISGKIYGDVMRRTGRILNTYADRENSTGVLLVGEKGSGKTMQAKLLCIEAAKLNIPTIIINAPFAGDGFNKLIQDIDQPCVVLFDEFEKTYNPETQEKVLTLLDGVFPSKKLFILTCNSYFRIDSNMKNRPGRLFYYLTYRGLAEDFIREYCQDELSDTSHIEDVIKMARLYTNFNFDMLKALVEEMNRYDETPKEALDMLNAKPEDSAKASFDIEVICDGIKVDNTTMKRWDGQPLTDSFQIGFYRLIKNNKRLPVNIDPNDVEYDDNDKPKKYYVTLQLAPSDIKSEFDGTFIYEKDGCQVRLTRKLPPIFDWRAY
jgi:hypothetical protein